MKIILIFFATILLFITSDIIYSQTRNPVWEVGATSVIGFGDRAPFWVVSNRQGKFLPEKYAGLFKLGVITPIDTGKMVGLDYGIELYGRTGSDKNAWLNQVYAGLTFYDIIRLRIGMQEEVFGSRQPSVSSGSLIWSGNARPMPKVEIGTRDYLPVPFTRGYAEFKSVISHGWFEKERFASDIMLHHKNLYVRLGGHLPVNIYYGINHFAMWGGSSPMQDDPYPSNFKSFIRVFMAKQGDPDEPGTPDSWIENRFGNHIGSRNYGLDILADRFSAGIYLQDIFEDTSGFNRRNYPDGLYGAWLRFTEEHRTLQAVVYEFIHTTNQSGPYHDLGGVGLGGNDNYFNHLHYQSGWSYHNYTIGTPLITSRIFGLNETHRLHNNRVIGHHIGFEGHISKTASYRSFFTFSRNFGTFDNPFEMRKDQFSWMFEITGPLEIIGMDAGITLAVDSGSMYGDNLGIVFTLSKKGNFNFR